MDKVEADVVANRVYRVSVLVGKDADEEGPTVGQLFFQGIGVACVGGWLAVLPQAACDPFRLAEGDLTAGRSEHHSDEVRAQRCGRPRVRDFRDAAYLYQGHGFSPM